MNSEILNVLQRTYKKLQMGVDDEPDSALISDILDILLEEMSDDGFKKWSSDIMFDSEACGWDDIGTVTDEDLGYE